MSAILIKWRMMGLTNTYFHVALLLNGLNPPVYISIYSPHTGKRFNSRTFSGDMMHGEIAETLSIPSYEDGNSFGISEGIMGLYWNEIYKLKKINDSDVKGYLEASEEKNLKDVGVINAVKAISSEFKMFQNGPLDCLELIHKILQKGGIDLYIPNTLPTNQTRSSMMKNKILTAIKNIASHQAGRGLETKTRKLELPKLTDAEEASRLHAFMAEKTLGFLARRY